MNSPVRTVAILARGLRRKHLPGCSRGDGGPAAGAARIGAREVQDDGNRAGEGRFSARADGPDKDASE